MHIWGDADLPRTRAVGAERWHLGWSGGKAPYKIRIENEEGAVLASATTQDTSRRTQDACTKRRTTLGHLNRQHQDRSGIGGR